jgi:hypothetical protein
MTPDKKITEVRTVQKESSKVGGGFSSKASQVVGLIFGLLEATIVLRILFWSQPEQPHRGSSGEGYRCVPGSIFRFVRSSNDRRDGI